MRNRIRPIVLVCALTAGLVPVATTPAQAKKPPKPTTAAATVSGKFLTGLHPGKTEPGLEDLAAYDASILPVMTDWQGGKRNAIVNIYTNSYLAGPGDPLFAVDLPKIWQAGSIPSVSFYTPGPNRLVIDGTYDGQLDLWAAEMKKFLAGPNGVYGDGDDRRAYLRAAWEANGNWMNYSPCTTNVGYETTATEFRAMWQHLHGRFAAIGLDRTRLQWVFSMNSWPNGEMDSSCGEAGSPRNLYPGDDYVDWLGLNTYNFASGFYPATVSTAMLAELRSISPTKPVGIDEGGTSSASVDKSRWLTELFEFALANDIRKVNVFSLDKEHDWPVFGGVNGDTTYTHPNGGPQGLVPGTVKGYASYRDAVLRPSAIGTDPQNPRYLTDAQFAGSL